MPDIPAGEVVAAAWAGDVSRLRLLLSAGAAPGAYDAEGWTPLLAACARGCAETVSVLLANDPPPSLDIGQRETGGLPIHLAGQSGSVAVVEQLLDRRPDQLDAAWELNGHTLLLQAVFFGHRALVELALRKGASTAVTTVRGLGALELAQQFDNHALAEIIAPHDSPKEAKTAYCRDLLRRIAPLNDRLAAVIEEGVMNAALDDSAAVRALAAVRDLVDGRGADVNALGGPLQQPPLIVAVTGNNGKPENPKRAGLRYDIVRYLLDRGASPLVRERHPMAVNAVIRAAVFNHLSILDLFAQYVSPQELERALNERPAVNGMTALHDTVLRAGTADAAMRDRYVEQVRWCVSHGARSDIQDFSGRTQRDLAAAIADGALRARLLALL